MSQSKNWLSNMSKIAIAFDAMGGDFAPFEIIHGAVLAAKDFGIKAILVGEKSRIDHTLSEIDHTSPFDIEDYDIEVLDAPDEITMDELNPARAVKRAQNSSIVLANKLVAEGKADAVVAAGHTGAASAAALFEIKRVKGFERPAIVCFIPTVNGVMLLIDAGANTYTTKEQMLQNVILGDVYAKTLLGVENPRIGLLNVGEEPGKGTELYKESYELIDEYSKSNNLNFVGNVESKTIIHDICEVAVCDGFTGNIHLKALEGGLRMFELVLKNQAKKSFLGKLAGLTLKSIGVFNHIRDHFHPSSYGGALLGGINGNVIISHGSSDSRAVRNSAKLAIKAVEAGLISKLEAEL